MATGTTDPSIESVSTNSPDLSDRLKELYPAVNEEETPLPRSWSPKDKFNFIGLSMNNLKVHYKGVGKSHNHKDAASVRATHPIPAACGIYYFEVTVHSKGRDGYIGIGLSAQGVNMNKLPGWDRYSYGYHGDDGNAFSSSNPGVTYGPTFTSGDVVGCCVNLIHNTCFYTKNGINLGIAFTDLPPNLYPTVGLQTPGEVVEANFGQKPFVFDIQEYMQDWRTKTRMTIDRFPVSDHRGEWQHTLQRMVSTYLIHHGYCSTAAAFCAATAQPLDEDCTSIQDRQRIQKLVLTGRMGEAIELTESLYPGLLDHNPNLLFTLKCRQFVEMVNGADSEMRGPGGRSPRSRHSSRSSPGSSPSHTPTPHPVWPLHPPPHPMAPPDSSSSSPSQGGGDKHSDSSSAGGKHSRSSTPTSSTSSSSSSSCSSHQSQQPVSTDDVCEEMTKTDSVSWQGCSLNGSAPQGEGCGLSGSAPQGEGCGLNGSAPVHAQEEEETMDLSERRPHHALVANGNCDSAPFMNGNAHRAELANGEAEEMDVEGWSAKQMCGGSQQAIEKMLQFGRELQAMSQRLRHQYGHSHSNKKAIQDAFSLLAYPDPWSSPVGFQLQPVQREPVCAALNSAILESQGLPKQPPLKLAMAQASQCMKLMATTGIGACAFASLSDYLH